MRPEFIEEMTDEELMDFLGRNAQLHAMVLSRRMRKRPKMFLTELLADITLQELLDTIGEME